MSFMMKQRLCNYDLYEIINLFFLLTLVLILITKKKFYKKITILYGALYFYLIGSSPSISLPIQYVFYLKGFLILGITLLLTRLKSYSFSSFLSLLVVYLLIINLIKSWASIKGVMEQYKFFSTEYFMFSYLTYLLIVYNLFIINALRNFNWKRWKIMLNSYSYF